MLLTALLLLLSPNANAMLLGNKTVASGLSMGSTVHTQGVNIDAYSGVSFQAVWTGAGSPVGNFTLEVSNDNVLPVESGGDEAANVTHWTTVGGSSTAISGDGDLSYNLSQTHYRWARVTYTRTGGTDSLNVEAAFKKESFR